MIAMPKRAPNVIKTSVWLAVAVLSMAACGSCGSSSGGSGAASSPGSGSSTTKPATGLTLPSDICTLVTADEASAALGTAVTNLGATTGATIPGACFYGSTGGTSSASLLIFAQAYPNASTAAAVQPDQIAAAFRGLYGIASAKAVTGIGDKAFEYSATSSTSGSSGIAIFVFKSNIVLFIAMSPSSDSGKIEGLARTAVGRLH